jgi:hypothetical protein
MLVQRLDSDDLHVKRHATWGMSVETCATDIQTHCADVAQGDGRIMACLMRNAAEVEAVSVTAVSKLSAAMKQ